MKKLSPILFTLLLLIHSCEPLAAQTNTIYGYVGDYSTNAQAQVTVVATLITPNPRTVGVWQVRQDPVSTTTATSGYYGFTNILWGKYRLNVFGANGTPFTFYVGTNTLGVVPISSLITNQAAVPYNTATNNYTQAQVDALIAGVVGRASHTNVFWGTNDPNNSLTADKGSVYWFFTNGVPTRGLVNTNNTTGWY